MVKIKVCGITNLKDALKIAKLKPDALGFVFYQKTPRYIEPEKAKEITRHIPKSIKKIGVFVNEKENKIKKITKDLKLDALQFHGNESPRFCNRFKNYKVIKAFRIKDKDSLKAIHRYSVWAYLFDTYKENLFGGTGRRFNWRLLKDIKIKNIFLSGGLDAGNVKKAIKLVKPNWVDVSSSVEKSPGRKDYHKVKAFIAAVKNLVNR